MRAGAEVWVRGAAAWLGVLALGCAIAACGGTDEANEPAEANTETSENPSSLESTNEPGEVGSSDAASNEPTTPPDAEGEGEAPPELEEDAAEGGEEVLEGEAVAAFAPLLTGIDVPLPAYAPASDQVVAVDTLGLRFGRIDVAASATYVAWPTARTTQPRSPVVVSAAEDPVVVIIPLNVDGTCQIARWESLSDTLGLSEELPGACGTAGYDGSFVLVPVQSSDGEAFVATVAPTGGGIVDQRFLGVGVATAPVNLGGGRWVVGVGGTLYPVRVDDSGILSGNGEASAALPEAPGAVVTSLALAGPTGPLLTTARAINEGSVGFGTLIQRVAVGGLSGPGPVELSALGAPIETPGEMLARLVAADACSSDSSDSDSEAEWWCESGGFAASSGSHWLGGWSLNDGAALFEVDELPVEAATGLTLSADGWLYSSGSHWLTGDGPSAAVWRYRPATSESDESATVMATIGEPDLHWAPSPLLGCTNQSLVQIFGAGGVSSLVSFAGSQAGVSAAAWARGLGDSSNSGEPAVACSSAPQCESAADCDDDDACTTDTCTADGDCVHAAVICDDFDVCNGAESCNSVAGCLPGTPLVCGDGNPCTEDSCHPFFGCTSTGLTGPLCSDGDPCTNGDTCQSGVCVPGPSDPACTNKLCQVSGSAGDLVACDLCLARGSAEVEAPTSLQFSLVYDSSSIKLTQTFDTINLGPITTDMPTPPGSLSTGHSVTVAPPSTVADWDGEGTILLSSFADPTAPITTAYVDSEGSLVTPEDALFMQLEIELLVDVPADDPLVVQLPGALASTASAMMQPTSLVEFGGLICPSAIVYGGVDGCSLNPSACDDGNPCTDDSCNATTGVCTSTPNAAPCEDGNDCTTGDTCSMGACVPGVADPACSTPVCQLAGAAGETVVCGLCLARDLVDGPKPAIMQFDVVYDPTQLKVIGGLDNVEILPGIEVLQSVPPSPLSSGHQVNLNPDPYDSWSGVGTVLLVNVLDPTVPITDAVIDGVGGLSDPEAALFMYLEFELLVDVPESEPAAVSLAELVVADASASGQSTSIATVAPFSAGAQTCPAVVVVEHTSCTSPPLSCDDGNPCTTDGCELAADQCSHTVNNDSCDDSIACSGGEVCAAGFCMPTSWDCDATPVCTLSGPAGETVDCQLNLAAYATPVGIPTAMEFDLAWDPAILEFLAFGDIVQPIPFLPPAFQPTPPSLLSTGHGVSTNKSFDDAAIDGSITTLLANLSGPDPHITSAIWNGVTVTGSPEFMIARFKLLTDVSADDPAVVTSFDIFGLTADAFAAFCTVVDELMVCFPGGP